MECYSEVTVPCIFFKNKNLCSQKLLTVNYLCFMLSIGIITNVDIFNYFQSNVNK